MDFSSKWIDENGTAHTMAMSRQMLPGVGHFLEAQGNWRVVEKVFIPESARPILFLSTDTYPPPDITVWADQDNQPSIILTSSD